MDNIIIDVKNNKQNILPVPYAKKPVPNVEYPINYGDAPYAMDIKPTPTRRDDELQYCNFLEPSPRNQNLNVPYQGDKDCPTFTGQPYSKDSCYLIDSKAQGVVGIACNQAGGSDNANFVRGNQFGVDYNQKEISMEDRKLQYTVEQPVQTPLSMENPLLMYDNNSFYPYPSFSLRGGKDFLTYPLEQNFSPNGYPIYRYPYKTMNPIEDKGSSNSNINEYFDDYNSNYKPPSSLWGLMIMLILVLLLIIIMGNYSSGTPKLYMWIVWIAIIAIIITALIIFTCLNR